MSAGAAPVTRADRQALNGHGGGVVYFTGLSGAGKATIAVLLEHRLHGARIRTCVLDGDTLRAGLCSNLGQFRIDAVRWTPDQATTALLARMSQLGFAQGSDAIRSSTSASSPWASTPVQMSAGPASAGPASAGPDAGKRLAQR